MNPEPTDGPLTFEELQLAARNRGIPLEALRHDITPTGMHYLLVHFDIPDVDPATWRLEVCGHVKKPFQLTLESLQKRPRTEFPVTIECAGNGRARMTPRPVSQPWLNEAVSTAVWGGTPLAPLLEEAGVKPGAVDVVFWAADHGVEKGFEHDYARSLTVADAMSPEILLAYEMNGRPLEPQHGAPLRVVVPGWYGMQQVKWLTRIDVVPKAFDGYQQKIAYHYKKDKADPGTPVQRIKPRALMIPPGFPDFLTRVRTVERGRVAIRGRAWSGHAAVARVEFGVDGAWRDAALGAAVGPHAWRSWSVEWDAPAGDHVLTCRATDAAGNLQPTDAYWNYAGAGNNMVQDVRVSVR
ncbi:MAG: sulfite [Planctomycetota bacterium]|nr:MAG: sulfite [Planctomycetota bacterium]